MGCGVESQWGRIHDRGAELAREHVRGFGAGAARGWSHRLERAGTWSRLGNSEGALLKNRTALGGAVCPCAWRNWADRRYSFMPRGAELPEYSVTSWPST